MHIHNGKIANHHAETSPTSLGSIGREKKNVNIRANPNKIEPSKSTNSFNVGFLGHEKRYAKSITIEIAHIKMTYEIIFNFSPTDIRVSYEHSLAQSLLNYYALKEFCLLCTAESLHALTK